MRRQPFIHSFLYVLYISCGWLVRVVRESVSQSLLYWVSQSVISGGGGGEYMWTIMDIQMGLSSITPIQSINQSIDESIDPSMKIEKWSASVHLCPLTNRPEMSTSVHVYLSMYLSAYLPLSPFLTTAASHI